MDLVKKIHILLLVALIAVAVVPENYPSATPIPDSNTLRNIPLASLEIKNPLQVQDIIRSMSSSLIYSGPFLHSGIYSMVSPVHVFFVFLKEIISLNAVPNKVYYHIVD